LKKVSPAVSKDVLTIGFSNNSVKTDNILHKTPPVESWIQTPINESFYDEQFSFAPTKRWFAATKRWFAPTKRWFAAVKQYADEVCATLATRSSAYLMCLAVIFYPHGKEKSIFQKNYARFLGL